MFKPATTLCFASLAATFLSLPCVLLNLHP